MAAKWLKEHDTKERGIDMIVREQFLTMLPEDIQVSEHKPETSMIAGKLTEDYQQAIKQQRMIKPDLKKTSKGGKRCLVCHKIGHLARDCPNITYKKNVRSTEGYHNTSSRDEFSEKNVLRYFTCDGKGHTSKQCPSKALFCGKWNKSRFGANDTVV